MNCISSCRSSFPLLYVIMMNHLRKTHILFGVFETAIKPSTFWGWALLVGSPFCRITHALRFSIIAHVWSGYQLHTGAQIVIKSEPSCPPTNRPTLLYEGAIYAQLEGLKCIPRIHWYGRQESANVLVMDKLAPNLQMLRQICRGALSAHSENRWSAVSLKYNRVVYLIGLLA